MTVTIGEKRNSRSFICSPNKHQAERKPTPTMVAYLPVSLLQYNALLTPARLGCQCSTSLWLHCKDMELSVWVLLEWRDPLSCKKNQKKFQVTQWLHTRQCFCRKVLLQSDGQAWLLLINSHTFVTPNIQSEWITTQDLKIARCLVPRSISVFRISQSVSGHMV